jgi:hypothetical protein
MVDPSILEFPGLCSFDPPNPWLARKEEQGLCHAEHNPAAQLREMLARSDDVVRVQVERAAVAGFSESFVPIGAHHPFRAFRNRRTPRARLRA